jgi:uncharacterized delta-60 repeat protein
MQLHQKTGHVRRACIETLECRTLLSAGDLDVSFSDNGKQAIDFGAGVVDIKAADVAVQKDGKTIVVGRAFRQATDAFDFAIARFNVDGLLDTTFGVDGNGKILTHVGNPDFESTASAVAIQPDGKIVVVGLGRDSDGGRGVALARFLPNGSFDTSFSGDGKQIKVFDQIGGGAEAGQSRVAEDHAVATFMR